jgi:hypothetical protein
MAEVETTDGHTPGPWLINPDAHRHEQGFYGTPPDESEPGTEEVYTAVHVGKSVQLTGFIRPQDARLIATAPEMFELLKKYAYDGHLQSFEDRERFRKDALVLIAKAEGRS